MSLKKIVDFIKSKNNFLVTSHVNLEGDAIGSELALSEVLKKLDKKVIIVNENIIPEEYKFLPGTDSVLTKPGNFKFDAVIFVDCSGFDRIGGVMKFIPGNKIILNIDHHISNTKFGTINWVEPKASSCVELIYKIYKKLKIDISFDAALCLYTGLMTDTGSFRHSNTTRFSHLMAADLLRYKIPLAKIYRWIYESNQFLDVKLLSKIMPTLRRDKSGKIAWLVGRREILKKRKSSFDITEILLNFIRLIKDVEVAILFKELPQNQIRINFRSQGNIDVNKLAQEFGGGGHPSASGCTATGKLPKVEKMILKKTKEILKIVK